MKTELDKIRAEQQEQFWDFNDTLFTVDQRINACMSVKQELERLESE